LYYYPQIASCFVPRSRNDVVQAGTLAGFEQVWYRTLSVIVAEQYKPCDSIMLVEVCTPISSYSGSSETLDIMYNCKQIATAELAYP